MISVICASLRILYGWLLFELGLDFFGFFSAIQVLVLRLFQDNSGNLTLNTKNLVCALFSTSNTCGMSFHLIVFQTE